jgi:predicted nucleic acid-binding protein
LIDERDGLHKRASRDLSKIANSPMGVTSLVLGETCFLAPAGFLRKRLSFLLTRLAITPVELDIPWWPEVFEWMDRYSEHEPDLADAQLAILCSRRPECRVWTYDKEFKTTWRKTNGLAIPLAP